MKQWTNLTDLCCDKKTMQSCNFYDASNSDACAGASRDANAAIFMYNLNIYNIYAGMVIFSKIFVKGVGVGRKFF